MAQTHGVKSIVSNGLVFYVDAKNKKSYPGSGSTLSDIGSGVDGTIYNATFDSSGHFDFDGTGDYISLDGFSSKLIDMTSLSLSVWFRYNSSGNSGYRYFLSMGDGNADWNVKKYHIAFNHNSHKFWWGAYGDTNSVNDNSGSAMTHNAIYNVVFNSDGTLYKNGVSDATGKTDVGFDNCQTINYFNIGALKRFGGIYGPQQVQTRVFQMNIYNRVLTASEVLQNYNAQKDIIGV